MPIVAIAHNPDAVGKFFHADDLARLRAAAEVRLVGQGAGVAAQMADVDYVMSSWGMPKLDAAFLAAAPRLRAACYAAGTVKGIATPEAYARGVTITSAWQANAVPVAEATVALLVLASKGMFRAMERIRADGPEGWRARDPSFTGFYRVTIGLVGFGAIGRLVAERLRMHEVDVCVHDPHADPAQLASLGLRAVSLEELAAQSDLVSLHAANLPSTRHLIGACFLAAMRDGAVLVNTARGALIDEAALIAELGRGRISAVLDVTDPEPPIAGSPLYRLPNCWLFPHRTGSAGREVQRMGRMAVDACLDLIAGRAPRGLVTQDMLATMA
jgi:phosphoglycerate dehydrogenase-like enzyme